MNIQKLICRIFGHKYSEKRENLVYLRCKRCKGLFGPFFFHPMCRCILKMEEVSGGG